MKAAVRAYVCSLFRPRVHSRRGLRFCALVALSGALLGLAGCNQGAEGGRCNPDLSHNECNSGLTCQQPAQCPENYCCPATGASSDPNCQPGCTPGGVAGLCATDPSASACVDAGADASLDAGIETGADAG
jgi:hypothetical protein